METLVGLGQQVTGLDNFSTGFEYNLDQAADAVGKEKWKNFRFIEGEFAPRVPKAVASYS